MKLKRLTALSMAAVMAAGMAGENGVSVSVPLQNIRNVMALIGQTHYNCDFMFHSIHTVQI